MSQPRDAGSEATSERLLAAPLRRREALLDRLVLALALAPRLGSVSESPLTPASKRRRRRARR